jgi:hypothetical protein
MEESNDPDVQDETTPPVSPGPGSMSGDPVLSGPDSSVPTFTPEKPVLTASFVSQPGSTSSDPGPVHMGQKPLDSSTPTFTPDKSVPDKNLRPVSRVWYIVRLHTKLGLNSPV